MDHGHPSLKILSFIESLAAYSMGVGSHAGHCFVYIYMIKVTIFMRTVILPLILLFLNCFGCFTVGDVLDTLYFAVHRYIYMCI